MLWGEHERAMVVLKGGWLVGDIKEMVTATGKLKKIVSDLSVYSRKNHHDHHDHYDYPHSHHHLDRNGLDLPGVLVTWQLTAHRTHRLKLTIDKPARLRI